MTLRRLTPNARALYWYLVATNRPQNVPEIAQQSGIPASSVYQAAQRFPDVFELTGSLMRHLPPTTPTVATSE